MPVISKADIAGGDNLRLIIHGMTVFELWRTGPELDISEMPEAVGWIHLAEVAAANGAS